MNILDLNFSGTASSLPLSVHICLKIIFRCTYMLCLFKSKQIFYSHLSMVIEETVESWELSLLFDQDVDLQVSLPVQMKV